MAPILILLCSHLAVPNLGAQIKKTDGFLRLLSPRSTTSLKVSFSYNPKFPKQGEVIQFVESSSGGPTSWIWDFGDGTMSTERNPTHAYSTSGFRKVTLTVATASASKKASRTVTILPETANATFVFSPTTPSPGQAVQFTDTTAGTPTAWLWNFGDGSTSTVKNPSHAYIRSGAFTVTLTATTSGGTKQGTRSLSVTEISVLSASFSYTPSTPLANQSIQFTDTSTGSPTAWLWNFGDGGTSSARHPIHVYSTGGSKTVTLTVTNSTGSNVATQTVTVGAALTASFSYSPSAPVAGQSIQFSDASAGFPTSWWWNFGDGATSTAQNPIHTYTTAGTKAVTLTVTNGIGSNVATQTVTVGAALTASFSYTPSAPASGQSIQFTDTSTGVPTSWLWNFGDGGTSSVQHPLHTYTTAGSKTVTLTVTNSIGSKTTSRTVTVLSALTASFTFSPASPATGQVVQFTDTSTGSPTNWQWNFGDGTTSVSRNPSHSYSSAGSFTVALTVMNASTSNTTSRTIVVGAALAASFTFSPASPATGQTVQFTDTSAGAPTSWSWNFSDGTTSTLQNPTRSYSTIGSKTVTLTVTNVSGSNTTTRTVTVVAAVTASFTFSPISPTTSQPVQFTDTSSGSPTSWSWNFGDGSTSTLKNPSHAYASSGTYTVSLTAAESSAANTTSRQITVVPAATLEASFSYSPSSPAPNQSVAFTDTSTGAPTSWQWNFGDGGTSALRNPSHAFTEVGTYTVTLIAQNASGSDTVSRTMTIAQTAEILPADRVYDWGSYCGVPGGIPNRTVIFRTMSPANTTAEINAAIAACPSGQVVYLSAGTYSLGQITFGYKSGATLRGAGAGKTIIQPTVSRGITNTYAEFLESAGIAVSSGYTRGSTSITLASSPSARFVAGNLIVISEGASPDKWGAGLGTYYREGFSTGNSIYNLLMTRVFHHVNRIVSVSGNSIQLAAPLPLSFSGSLNVKAYAPVYTNAPTSLCGVEDLTVDCRDTYDYAVRFSGADRCWVKNVEVKNVNGGDIGVIRFDHCFQSEIRRCYIHDTTGYPNQVDGQGSSFNYGTSNCLLVDCIVDNMASMNQSNGAAANAYLYNYSRDTARAGVYTRGVNINHGPHGYMGLVEGNVMSNFVNDGYHGSTSHAVVFRNHINGLNNDVAVQKKLVNLSRGSYFQSIVGNVIGDSSWNPVYYDQPVGATATSAIFALGWPTTDTLSFAPYTSVPWVNWAKPIDRPDADVARTLIRHGNYDYYNKAVIWDSGIVSHEIPDSFFYSSKPAFFGSLQWPPIGPDVSGLVADIPAKARWNAFLRSGNPDDLYRDY